MGIATDNDVAAGLGALAHMLGGTIRRSILEGGSRRSGMASLVPDPLNSRGTGSSTRFILQPGTVVRSGIGSYDCEVQIGSVQIVCGALTTALGAYYGVSQASLPAPGTPVAVLVAVGEDNNPIPPGYVVGMYPGSVNEPISSDGVSQSVGSRESPEGGVSQAKESSAAMIASDATFPHHGEFRASRPADMAPGEYGLLNTWGGGVVVGAVSTQVRGSEFASVQCSSLDDSVRVLARNMDTITGVGSSSHYCDGPHLSSEHSVSSHLAERLGLRNEDDRPFKVVGGAGMQERPDESYLAQEDGQTAISRLRAFTGYLGDLVNAFVVHPGSGGTNKLSSDPVEQGLLHLHVDTNGRAALRSAAGIVLERYDKIPVPKRTHQVWDPAGNVGKDVKPKKRRDFDWQSDKYPGAVGLVLGDMAAWWNSQAYTRFSEFEKDFKIKKQTELLPLDKEHDRLGNASSDDLSSFKDRHSYFSLTPDGGIVLRDAWGSEIVMQGGNITFSAAHDVYVRPGRNAVTLAGDDVIVKAYNSVDVTSTSHDVRIKAQNNLQLAAIKRGVLIESQSTDMDEIDWTQPGEDLKSCGVFIHAKRSGVHCIGKTVHMSGTSAVNIDTFDAEGKPAGELRVSSKSATIIGTESVLALAGKGKSGLKLAAGAFAAFGPSVVVAGSNSLRLQSGKKHLMAMQVDGDDLYGNYKSEAEKVIESYVDSTKWVAPFSPKTADDIAFRFRPSKQYSTDPLDPNESSFRLYKPSWVFTAEAKLPWARDLTLDKVATWTEEKDVDDEYPWPGKDVYERDDAYVGFAQGAFDNAKRCEEDDVPDRADLTPGPLSGYHILRRKDS